MVKTLVGVCVAYFIIISPAFGQMNSDRVRAIGTICDSRVLEEEELEKGCEIHINTVKVLKLVFNTCTQQQEELEQLAKKQGRHLVRFRCFPIKRK